MAGGLPGTTPHTQLAGYDRWVAKANNASFRRPQAAYDELVPAFEALFEREAATGPGFKGCRATTHPMRPSLSATAALRALTPSKEKPGV